MAVQLTRYPNALVSALHKLTISPTASVKGAGGLEFLFIVWPGSTSSNDAVIGQFGRMHPKLHKRQRRLRALGATNVSDAQTRGARWSKGTWFGVVLLTAIVGPLMAVAFGLSLAVGRYEDRRAATVAEANAIGTTYLRAQLVAEPARSRSLEVLRSYTDLALRVSKEVPASPAMRRSSRRKRLAPERSVGSNRWRSSSPAQSFRHRIPPTRPSGRPIALAPTCRSLDTTRVIPVDSPPWRADR
jgi:hypothetical protein